MTRLLALVVALLLIAAPASAAKARKKVKRKRPAPTPAGPVEIPVEIAAGPILLVPSPPAVFEQPAHFGLQIQAAAVVDRELIRQHKNQIPPWARGYAQNLNEVKVRPWWLALVPELLVLSPQIPSLGLGTGMYGAVWRPLGVGLTLVDTAAFRVKANAGLDAVALLVHSQTLGGGTPASQSVTLVLRPGLNLAAVGELPLSKELIVSGGWSSDLFVPQALGRPPWEIGPLDDSLWHLGGPFLMLAYRFPLALD